MSQYIGNKPAEPLPIIALNDLTDVSTAGATTGDLLSFGGSSWGKLTPAFASSAQGSLADSAIQPGDNANLLGSTGAAAGTFLGANGSGGVAWSNLPNVDTLSSGGAAAGRVLTANGSGGASFTATLTVFEGQIQTTPGTNLSTTGTLTLDFSGASLLSTGTLTGNITFATSNLAAGRSVTVRVVNGSTLRTVNFPTNWVFVGPKPTDILGSKTAILTATAFGTADADVVAAWAVQE
jgi:hypothetical protein